MAAYFVVTFLSIRDQVVVNYYEVEEGSLVKQTGYTGLILREEEIVDAGASGYIYYYIADGRKVAAGNPVYAIDEGGDLSEYLSSGSSLTIEADSSRVKEIRSELMDDSRSFSNASFSSLYSIADSVEAGVLEYTSLSIFSNISSELKDEGISFTEFTSSENGTVCCYTDGYESLTESEISSGCFDTAGYEKNTIKAGDLVSAGSPAYKLITSENWQIVFELTDEDLESLREKSAITVSFEEKGFSTRADARIIYGTDQKAYGVLDMSSYQVQFTADRFVDFDIVTNNVSGLKIPDKSITTKDFYVIPKEYMHTDDNGNEGFYKAVIGEDGTYAEFVVTDIYDTDDEYCYIDCDEDSELSASDCVVMPDDLDDLYQIGLMLPLTGVYNINKGYTVFRKVEILESANGYSIIKKNTQYGLSTYDHIVLDTETVSDDQLLYR